MSERSLGNGRALPKPFDAARVERTMDAIAAAGVVIDKSHGPLLAATFGNSPYLARLALREAQGLARVLEEGPEPLLRDVGLTTLAVAQADSEADAMSTLRAAKRRAALAIALADISGMWDVDRVTRALSDFADGCVSGALQFLLRQTALRSGHPELDGATLEATTGLVVLAMGKYGAFELNYSSDIDLVIFYDSDRFPFRARDDKRAAAVAIVRGLVRLLGEITSDGYVFRTDLRLRPDAGATQVAISTEAAEAYYETMGQNWERAAMIKARACAGDPEISQRFLKSLEPFVWRRHLDYAAIEDIHSIKRQIHAHAGHGSIAVAGHNIKLGRGGIREIEFFAQTQQLILGGRNRHLRQTGTIDALEALCAQGLLSRDTAHDLQKAYRFLRRLEHRLQMIEDEQTHTLPKSVDGIAHVSCFMGFPDTEAFGAALRHELEIVQRHYAQLFERSQELASDTGNLVFTGVEDDPDTLQSLSEMGFRDAHHVAGAIRGWHHGRIPATRSARARELLTRLVPVLLKSLASTPEPDAAFKQFDRFVSNIPAGVQLFSLLLARDELLHLIANIMGAAPRLARHLGHSPQTLDALMDADFLRLLPTCDELDRLLATLLQSAAEYEDKLDAVRRFAREQMFRVGVQVIEGIASAQTAGRAFANIAESIIAALVPIVEEELAKSAGHIPGGAFAIVAMGKLGGREMSATSDLDLIFVYDAPSGVESSDGERKLPLIVYYARLAQRLIAALTVPTAAGELYEVDMRLRPSGNKGPAAVSLESFAQYHERESWTWERMALTRARVICGSAQLKTRIESVIDRTVAAHSKERNVRGDARKMRDRLESQFPGRSHWDLKFTRGGLVDIEFIAQTLQLGRDGLRRCQTLEAIEAAAGAGVLSQADALSLIDAASAQLALSQVLRIALEEPFQAEGATPGLKTLLTRTGAATSFEELEMRLSSLQSRVREIFEKILP